MSLLKDISEQIKENIDLIRYISQYTELRQCGKEWKGRCPLPDHDDTNPSFTISPEGLWYCFGCNRGGTVIEFAALHDGLTAREAIDMLAHEIGLSTPELRGTPFTPAGKLKLIRSDHAKADDPGQNKERKLYTLEEITSKSKHKRLHFYRDPTGDHILYMKVIERDDETIAKCKAEGKPIEREPKTARFYIPRPGGLWVKARGEIKELRTLYELHRVLTAAPQEIILIPEGEKDVDTAHSLGFVATTAGSAYEWLPQFARHFEGRMVAVIPDNDEPGRDVAGRIVGDCNGVSTWTKLVQLPAKRVHDDLTDWVEHERARGRTDADIRDDLLSMIAKAPTIEKQMTIPTQGIFPKKQPPARQVTGIKKAETPCMSQEELLLERLRSRSRESGVILQRTLHLPETPAMPNDFLVSEDETHLDFFRQDPRTHRITHMPLCEPIVPVGRIIDLENRNHPDAEYFLIRSSLDRYGRPGVREGHITANLADSTEAIRDIGKLIFTKRNRDGAKKIIDFVQDYAKDNFLPVLEGRKSTGWKDGRYYLPGRNLPGTRCTSPLLAEQFTTKGSKEELEKLVREMLQTKGGIALVATFASTLLAICRVENFAVLLSGGSREGKSASCAAAMACFGDPAQLKFNWRGSIAGWEQGVLGLRDFTYWPDDIGNLKVTQHDEAISFFMLFANGKARTLTNEAHEHLPALDLRAILLSSAEIGLQELMEDSKEALKGIYRRVIEIDSGQCLQSFDESFTVNARDTHLRATADFGHYAIPWIEYVESNLDGIKERFAEIESACKLDGKWSLLLTTARLLEDFIPGVKAIPMMNYIFREAEKHETAFKQETDTAVKTLEAVRDYVTINRGCFMDGSEVVNPRNIHGKIDTISGHVFVVVTVMKEICRQAKVPYNMAVRTLVKEGHIEKDPKAESSQSQVKLCGHNTRGYWISL